MAIESELLIEALIERHFGDKVIRTSDGFLRTYYAGFSLSDLSKVIADEINQALVGADPRWRPIETAPKDGTRIDIWHPDKGRCVNAHWRDVLYAEDIPWGWTSTDWGRITGATHWMPRPASPNTIATPALLAKNSGGPNV